MADEVLPAKGAGQTALTADVSRRIKRESEMVYNVHQRFIVIGRDRLTLILQRNRSKLVRGELLIGLTGLVTSLLLAIVTSAFDDQWGIEAAQWQTVFIIGLAASGAWLALELGRLAFRRVTIESLVDKIEQESDRPLG